MKFTNFRCMHTIQVNKFRAQVEGTREHTLLKFLEIVKCLTSYQDAVVNTI